MKAVETETGDRQEDREGGKREEFGVFFFLVDPQPEGGRNM